MNQENHPVTVLDFINYSVGLLKESKIPDPRLNSELMLCDVLKCDRMKLYVDFEKPVSNPEAVKLSEYLRRRGNHEPLQYILKKAMFYESEFYVNKNVMIPRPDTEILVERVLSDISKSQKNQVSIFEIGTGSGCISISLAKCLEQMNLEYSIFSIDNSKEAIETASQNLALSKQTGGSIRLYCKDVFEIERLTKQYDYIVSNPPYISIEEFETLDAEVKNFEPKAALTDFGNGLKFYEKILKIASDNDFEGKVFCEIGYNQKTKLEKILNDYGLRNYFLHKDYSGIDRVLEIIK